MSAPVFLPVRPAVPLAKVFEQSQKQQRALKEKQAREDMARDFAERLPLPAFQVDVPLVARRATGIDFYGGNLQFTACMTTQQMRDAIKVLHECLGEDA